MGEPGQQVHQLLGLTRPQSGNQVIGQRLRRDMGFVEELESLRCDLHRPRRPVLLRKEEAF